MAIDITTCVLKSRKSAACTISIIWGIAGLRKLACYGTTCSFDLVQIKIECILLAKYTFTSQFQVVFMLEHGSSQNITCRGMER